MKEKLKDGTGRQILCMSHVDYMPCCKRVREKKLQTLLINDINIKVICILAKLKSLCDYYQ